MNKPYSVACDNNREPILSVIKPLFTECQSILEVGSGTGQHAVFFAENMPHLVWHTSDLEEHHGGIKLWLDDAALNNINYPILLDVKESNWAVPQVDAVFSANTAHIMSWDEVCKFISGIAGLLPEQGLFVLYGPFNFNNSYTSDSNRRFDGWLRERDPHSGIRNFEDLDNLAKSADMSFENKYVMPANNHILVWKK